MTAPRVPTVTVRALGARVGDLPILTEVSLDVDAGEIVVLFGPSGAGKSTIAAAVADLDRPGIHWQGEILVDGSPDDRPSRVGHLPQDAPATLNPARRVGRVLDDVVRLRCAGIGGRSSRPHRRARVAEVLRMAGFDLPARELAHLRRRFPHQFSGGERTRLALAQVLASEPRVLVLDEPTVGLDPLSRERLFLQLEKLRSTGLAILLVTHDRAAVSRLADRTVLVSDGRVVGLDRATTAEPPTPERQHRRAPRSSTPAAQLRAVEVRIGRTSIVDGVDLELRHGETLGMVGVSGAGKSTIARSLAGLAAPTRGTILVGGRPFPVLRRRSRGQLAAVQYIWQEAAASFEPGRRVLDQVAATAVRLRRSSAEQARKQALECLSTLELDEERAMRYPIGLSGGQLQRAAVARALLAEPSVLLCDEVTTGLDEPLARRILDALRTYQDDSGAAILLIGHDIRIMLRYADRIAVVEGGRVVETGTPAGLSTAGGASALRRLIEAGSVPVT